MNNHCLLAIKHKHSKWTKYQNSNSDVNYAQYKIARNLVISKLRKAKYNYEKDLDEGSQPMSFREMLREKLSIVTEFSLLSRPPIYCKLLFSFFLSLFFFSERLF